MKELSIFLQEYLGLSGCPVGIAYSHEPDPSGKSRYRYACVALRHAFSGESVNVSSNLVCPGGLHWLGFMNLEEVIVPFLTMIENLFSDSTVTRHWFRCVPQPVPARAGHLVMKPLEICDRTPDLVALLVSAAAFHDVLGLLSFTDGGFRFVFRQCATCQGVITNPVATGTPSACVPDQLSRKLARFSEGDILVSMPYRDALKMRENAAGWGFDTARVLKLLSLFGRNTFPER